MARSMATKARLASTLPRASVVLLVAAPVNDRLCTSAMTTVASRALQAKAALGWFLTQVTVIDVDQLREQSLASSALASVGVVNSRGDVEERPQHRGIARTRAETVDRLAVSHSNGLSFISPYSLPRGSRGRSQSPSTY
jgi:hypothetical protein